MTQPAATVELAQLADTLARAGGVPIQEAAGQLVAEGAQLVEQQARSYAPRRTGALASSITTHMVGPLLAEIAPGVAYAPYQEYGARPHVIRPRHPGGRLVFTVNGRKVVARVVHHPGNAAHPFMRPAATSAAESLASQLGEKGADLITQEHP